MNTFIVIDERGIIESFNRAAERTFAYDTGEVVGKNLKNQAEQLIVPLRHYG